MRLGTDIRRREFITLLGSAAAIWPRAARGQQATLPVIGYLSSRRSAGADDVLDAFRNGLRESGFIEGQNVAIEYRWAEDQYDRLPALAAKNITLPPAANAGPQARASSPRPGCSTLTTSAPSAARI